jgi:hypothetical protein
LLLAAQNLGQLRVIASEAAVYVKANVRKPIATAAVT